MPEVNDLVGATLNYKLKVAQGNVRKFLASATEGVQLGQYADVVDKILAAVDEIEKKTGAPLDEANKDGWKALTTKIEVGKAHMSSGCTAGATASSCRALTGDLMMLYGLQAQVCILGTFTSKGCVCMQSRNA